MLGKFKLLVGFGWFVSTVTKEEYTMWELICHFQFAFIHLVGVFG